MNPPGSNWPRFELLPWEGGVYDIPGRRMLDAHKTGGEIDSPGSPEHVS